MPLPAGDPPGQGAPLASVSLDVQRTLRRVDWSSGEARPQETQRDHGLWMLAWVWQTGLLSEWTW